MELAINSEAKKNIGEIEYLVKEGNFFKIFISVSSFILGIWLFYSYFYLNVIWVYGIFLAKIPPILIIALSIVLIFFGAYSLLSTKNNSEIKICRYGLLLNDNKVFYDDIKWIYIKRGFVVKVVVETAKNKHIYKASKFTHKDYQAIKQVSSFILNYKNEQDNRILND